MDAKTSEEAMHQQLVPILNGALPKEYGWIVDVVGLIAFVTMSPRRKPESKPEGKQERKFLLRIGFDQFPMLAPTYGFAGFETRDVDVAAAPPNVLHGSGGICCPGTREFHEKIHKGDAAYPWSPDRYPASRTLQNIHKLMERGVGA